MELLKASIKTRDGLPQLFLEMEVNHEITPYALPITMEDVQNGFSKDTVEKIALAITDVVNTKC